MHHSTNLKTRRGKVLKERVRVKCGIDIVFHHLNYDQHLIYLYDLGLNLLVLYRKRHKFEKDVKRTKEKRNE